MPCNPVHAPKMDKRSKTVLRLHHGRLGPASSSIDGVFRYVRHVAETAAMVSRNTGITDTHTIDTMIYHTRSRATASRQTSRRLP